jgi:hypothetical protein
MIFHPVGMNGENPIEKIENVDNVCKPCPILLLSLL